MSPRAAIKAVVFDLDDTLLGNNMDVFLPGCPPSAELIWKALMALVEGKPLDLTYDLVKFD